MYNLEQLFTTSVFFLWIYDYLLTLGDEVWSIPAFFYRYFTF